MALHGPPKRKIERNYGLWVCNASQLDLEITDIPFSPPIRKRGREGKGCFFIVVAVYFIGNCNS
jgi:hypothetical protein